jgi:protein gp37
MGQKSSIEWTDATWNPTTGCDRVSPGCDHCYALTLAKRLKAMGNARYQHDGNPNTSGPGFGLTLHHDKIEEPLRWKTPRRIFVNSMSDLFHDDVPEQFIADVFHVMREARWHQFQVLTKRPRRMAYTLQNLWSGAWAHEPAPNVWLGTSVEDQKRAELRIPRLLETPAAVRFLSCEPLLDRVDITPWIQDRVVQLEWVIVGGESGAGARPMDLEWVQAIRDDCTAAGIAFFFKQWGGRTPKAGGRSLDGRTWDEWPTDRSVSADREAAAEVQAS